MRWPAGPRYQYWLPARLWQCSRSTGLPIMSTRSPLSRQSPVDGLYSSPAPRDPSTPGRTGAATRSTNQRNGRQSRDSFSSRREETSPTLPSLVARSTSN